MRACILALLLAACDSECTTNADCPAGSFCSVGGCASECRASSECVARLGAGAVCDGHGRCTFNADGGGAESCAAPNDEDMDGAIDEGCGWHFGVPHAPASLLTYSGEVQMPQLRGGLRLYFRGGIDAPSSAPRFYVASRASTAAAFGAPSPLAGPPELESRDLRSITLSSDELEAIVYGPRIDGTMGTELLRMTRDSLAAPFGPLEPLLGLGFPDGISAQPFLRDDGLEILFSGQPMGAPIRRIYRSVRADRASPWQPPVELSFQGGSTVSEVTPTLTDDGLTIFFARDLADVGRQIFMARRASLDSIDFDTPVEVIELNVAGATSHHAFVSQATREVFFVSNRAWSGSSNALWRARVCREAACPAMPMACAGTLSPDGTHCYTAGTGLVLWSDGQAACETMGAHLATIHSADEGALVWSLRADTMSGAHIGLFEMANAEGSWSWVTGEPFIYRAWGAMQPDDAGLNEDCAHMWSAGAGQWNDNVCSTAADGYVCEREQWPVW